MNSKYTSDPTLCADARDLKILLQSFGPKTGRYHVNFPRKWDEYLRKHIDNWGDSERLLAREIIIRAKNRKALLQIDIHAPKGLKTWNPAMTWSDNLLKLMSNASTTLDGALVHPETAGKCSVPLLTLEDLPFSGSEDVTIPCTPSEFSRVSDTILKISPEVCFIDPYLDIARSNRKAIIDSLMQVVVSGQCESVKFFARTSEIRDLNKIEQQLRHYKRICNNVTFTYYSIDDQRCENPMHARYLFSIHGGIRVDRGFQSLTNRRTDVSPIGDKVLNELTDTFLERLNPSFVDKTIVV